MSIIVAFIFLSMIKLSASVIDVASVYVGQVNFEDILSNAGEGESLQQLDDAFSNFIGGPTPQLSEEPTSFGASVQAAAQSFIGDSAPSEVNFPEFDDLVGSLSNFGFTKGYMEIGPQEKIPLVDSFPDSVLIN